MSFSVLLVGCGAIAGGYDAAKPANADPLTHAGAFSRDGRFRLAACVDPDADKRAAFCARWGVEAGFATLDQAAALAPFDVVSICSPTAHHAADLDAVLPLRPRLVFCEKPVTPDLAQTRRLVAACDAAGVALVVNHTRRWDPAMVRLREELSSGKWGAIRAANSVYNKGVLNNGSHMIDLLHFLLGPLTLVAAGAPIRDFFDTDPTVPAILSTAGGVAVTLGTAHAADYALFEVSIVCERGVITMEDGGAGWRLRVSAASEDFPGYRMLDRGTWQVGEYGQAMLRAVGEIHDRLARGAALSSTGHTAAEAQAVCAAIKHEALAHASQSKEHSA